MLLTPIRRWSGAGTSGRTGSSLARSIRSNLWAALRYIERNPVRARMVEQASAYRWSSAAGHCGAEPAPQWLAGEPFASTFTAGQWETY
jgi:hypothetical protein